MEIAPVGATPQALQATSELMRTCFPHARHLTARYLEWLYAANPEGPVLGYEAREGGRLVAHYACIPAAVDLLGVPARTLLSLNTATHPQFRGRGLVTQLARRVFDDAAAQGFDAVYGVANDNSTGILQHKLGFQQVRPLAARLCLRAPVAVDATPGAFRRRWSEQALRWRCANPASPVRAVAVTHGAMFFTATHYPGIQACAALPVQVGADARAPPGLRLVLGLGAASTSGIEIPRRLRPRPLNLMFLDLRGARRLPPDEVRFSFLDFDAF